MTDPTPSSAVPSLTPLATLQHPSGTYVRAWQSTPHPSSSPAHPLLATASSDKTIHIWSLRSFRLLSSITGGHKRSIRCVGWKDYGSRPKRPREAIDPDDQEDGSQPILEKKDPVVLATGSFDANVGIWIHDEDFGKPMTNVELDTTAAGDEIDMDDRKSEDNGDEDEEWHFSTLLTGPDSEIKSIEFSPAHYSTNLLATSSRDKSVWVWEEVEPDEWETIAVLQEHTGDVKCVSWCKGAAITDPEEANGQRVLGSRELLASASYDDTIRLWRDVEEEGDWMCVGVIDGHDGTVWSVSWESHIPSHVLASSPQPDQILPSSTSSWQPRLASSSDDLTVRTWRRKITDRDRDKQRGSTNTPGTRKLPSIIRPQSSMETWEADATLPSVHVRSIYAIDWSHRTGLIVSCGGDGTIAVYKEEASIAATAASQIPSRNDQDGDTTMSNNDNNTNAAAPSESDDFQQSSSKWSVVALHESAHDEFEINHVCWALRRDEGKTREDEEVIVSTGDDGCVRVWVLPDGVV